MTPVPFPFSDATRCRVLVAGDVMLDRYWFGAVERISPEAPVPIVRVARAEDRLGGAANVARNIVALGAQATLVGIIGADEAGSQVTQLLDAAGISHQLAQDTQLPTTLKMRVLGHQQQLLRVDFEATPSPAALTTTEAALRALIADHHVLVLSDYAKGALSHAARFIALAREAGVPVLVDPKGDDYSRYRGADLVTPNRLEMQQAVGRWASEEDLNARAQALRVQLDLQALLVTRSEEGMTLFTAQGRDHVHAQAHEVFDVSGAGDTVLATLAVTRAAGLDWPTTMRWANRAGGIVVGKLGTSIVQAAELAGELS